MNITNVGIVLKAERDFFSFDITNFYNMYTLKSIVL